MNVKKLIKTKQKNFEYETVSDIS